LVVSALQCWPEVSSTGGMPTSLFGLIPVVLMGMAIKIIAKVGGVRAPKSEGGEELLATCGQERAEHAAERPEGVAVKHADLLVGY